MERGKGGRRGQREEERKEEKGGREGEGGRKRERREGRREGGDGGKKKGRQVSTSCSVSSFCRSSFTVWLFPLGLFSQAGLSSLTNQGE